MPGSTGRKNLPGLGQAAADFAAIDNALDTINRIASNTQFGTRKLQERSSGISGVVSDSNVTFLKGTSDTQASAYSVAVTTTGQDDARAAFPQLGLPALSLPTNSGGNTGRYQRTQE
ncbi:MAG: hypothetical protein RIK87_19210 [Fuerstiella sp.]